METYNSISHCFPTWSYSIDMCAVVQSMRLALPFVTTVHIAGGATRYEDNHAITGKVMYDTASGILGDNLRSECVSKNKWPWEL